MTTNLDCVVRVRTNDRVDRVAGVYYEPIVGRAMHVLRVVGHRVRRFRHRQSGQLGVQITVGVLFLCEYDEVRFTRGLKRNDKILLQLSFCRESDSESICIQVKTRKFERDRKINRNEYRLRITKVIKCIIAVLCMIIGTCIVM